jgi:hypothetical protein
MSHCLRRIGYWMLMLLLNLCMAIKKVQKFVTILPNQGVQLM